MSRILALWLPNWPVQRLVRDQPEHRRCAIVLYEQDAHCNPRVTACSAAAWNQAVRPGMPLAEARSLLGANTTAPPVFVCRDASRDREALIELARWCEQFSPLVGLDQTDTPDSLLLDVAGSAHLFGGEAMLARTIIAASRQQDLIVRVAIADTIDAAWGSARWGIDVDEGDAATASEADVDGPADRGSPNRRDAARRSPAASVVIPPGDTAMLANLPVETLRLSSRATEQLHRLGVRRIGQLLRLSRASLAARFGESLIRQLDKLTGAVVDPLVTHRAREPLTIAEAFEQPTTHRIAIERMLENLLNRLASRLRDQGQGVLRLNCQLTCQNRQRLSIDVNLVRPAVGAQHLLSLARLQLALITLPDAVEEIQIHAATTAPCQPRQGELFGNAPRDQPAQLAWLIERLSNRLGRQHVVRAELQAEPQAELAYRYQPLAGEPSERRTIGQPRKSSPRKSSPRKSPSSEPSPSEPSPPEPPSCESSCESPGEPPFGPLLRPLRLFDPPQPIVVVGIAVDGPPAVFHYQRRRHRVARCFGPERIETGWWRGESSRRDYYRVETDRGDRWWLFRRLQDQRWFLQGVFD